MEYTQWGNLTRRKIGASGLNPCCNGIYSMSGAVVRDKPFHLSLNPCCNGIYSMRWVK